MELAAMTKQQSRKKKAQGHTHVDEQGLIHKCYHKCRSTIFSFGFWLGVTLSFPIEHFIWEKVYPFNAIGHYFGL